MNRSVMIWFLFAVLACAALPVSAGETKLSYGGYIKMDVLSTYYRGE